jgi:predicted deacylase
MRTSFEIAGETIAPGARRTINLPVARLYTDTPLSMPVRVVHGRRPGPTLFVSAAIHGDELNGVEVVHRLLRHPALGRLRGTLLAVPVVNVLGFLNRSRYLPDRRDLNRSFPGSVRGSLAARMAHLFSEEIVARSDFGIDLHTGAMLRANLPQIRTDVDDPRSLAMAKAFGAPLILMSGLRDGSLREHARESGVPVLLYEAGEALRFSEAAIRTGLRGILRVMEELEMLAPRKRKASSDSVIARQSQWVRASAGGVMRGGVALGSWVTEGQVLVTIGDPMGEDSVEAVSPFDGVVIGTVTSPLVNEGDALVHLARPGRPEDASARIQDLVPDVGDTTDPGAISRDAWPREPSPTDG